MDSVQNSATRLSKVLWHCKRGMLELDLMLQNFCEQAFSTMPLAKQDLFEELLQEQDQDLQRWLIAGVPTPNAKFQDMVLVIRHLHTMRNRAAQQG